MVTADGSLVHVSREADGDELRRERRRPRGRWASSRRLTLDVVPTFDVRQVVYDDLPEAELDRHFDEILVRRLQRQPVQPPGPAAGLDQVWLKQLADDPGAAWSPEPRWLGGTAGRRAAAPGTGHAAGELHRSRRACPGPWHERLPHFRLEFTPSSGRRAAVGVLRARAMPRRDAWRALRTLAPLVAPVVQISEIRTVAADDLWLSPAHGRDSVAFHFTWLPDAAAVAAVLAAVEAALAPYAARPHWGKVSTVPPQEVALLYRRYDDFAALLRRRDPEGKFRNDVVDRFFPADPFRPRRVVHRPASPCAGGGRTGVVWKGWGHGCHETPIRSRLADRRAGGGRRGARPDVGTGTSARCRSRSWRWCSPGRCSPPCTTPRWSRTGSASRSARWCSRSRSPSSRWR